MALNKQVHIYSVDTSAFYTEEERRWHWRLCNAKKRKEYIKDYIQKANAFINANPDSKYIDFFKGELSEADKKSKEINGVIGKYKKKLLELLADYFEHNEKNKYDVIVRNIDNHFLVDKNVISIFESSLTRMLEMKTNELSDALIVVKVFYFDIIKDLIHNGFYWNGEKYRFFTSSAGQIRTKKTVFIKESLWNKYEKTIMCGLTVDQINAKGGINVNKYLAYLALSNSATDSFDGIDIHKSIVVDDFENEVEDVVDFIDDKTYQIERKKMKVPITQTDGAGMMLPCVSGKNFMIRIPWVKGLLGCFPFDEFIREANEKDPTINHGLIKDIYGVEHDILKEDIQVIFTKSQFKMHKYYNSWDEYIQNFDKYNCEISICNKEEDKIPNSCISYQMLQSLCDTTEVEIKKIANRSMKRIANMSSDIYTMLNVFGVNEYNHNKTALQKSIEVYPELLNDTYLKDIIRSIKNSMIKNYKSGKLDILGKYTFVLPDWYAFCEKIFHVGDSPKGILKRNQVSCRLFNAKKVDCLRSPSLFREHGIRENVIDEVTKKWFLTDAIYFSDDDLLSKILQYDEDGDCLLVVAEHDFVNVAERQMKDIVPLYYEMKKAEPVNLNGDNIYNGLNAAYTGGNIGVYSNAISKIWNSCNVTDDAIKVIKLLVMENNFTIDYAKTLYKPTRPDNVNDLIKQYTKSKLPHFFIYAKDKTTNQVEQKNDSVVNQLDDLIKDRRLKFALKDFGKINYRYLMNNSNIEIDEDLIQEYKRLNHQYHYKINMENCHDKQFMYIASNMRNELNKFGYSEMDITDMLVKYFYGLHNSRSKEALWFCYGDYIYNNLVKNIGNKTSICYKCGCRFKPKYHAQKYCEKCENKENSIKVKCMDCGKEIEVSPNATKTYRCEECQKKYNQNQMNNKYWDNNYRKVVCCDCKRIFYVDKKDNQTVRCDECQKIATLEKYKRYNKKRK